jgi:hypothetical protein
LGYALYDITKMLAEQKPTKHKLQSRSKNDNFAQPTPHVNAWARESELPQKAKGARCLVKKKNWRPCHPVPSVGNLGPCPGDTARVKSAFLFVTRQRRAFSQKISIANDESTESAAERPHCIEKGDRYFAAAQLGAANPRDWSEPVLFFNARQPDS